MSRSQVVFAAHHEAWLSVHTDRSREWLGDRLRDGFDVHHLDGDHGNNDPANLVLIEAADHMRLHGMTGFLAKRLTPRGVGRPKGGGRPKGRVSGQVRNKIGLSCYAYRKSGLSWLDVSRKTGLNTKEQALGHAKRYADEKSLQWPI